MLSKIDSFKGKYNFLSNFWPAQVHYDGITYPTVEHAYQAAKTTDLPMRKAILTCLKAKDAKEAGQLMPLRKDWEEVKVHIMYQLVRDKFRDHGLAEQLLNTGDAELIEGNWWGDMFWGVCNGKGENNLGKILMRVREELKQGDVAQLGPW